MEVRTTWHWQGRVTGYREGRTTWYREGRDTCFREGNNTCYRQGGTLAAGTGGNLLLGREGNLIQRRDGQFQRGREGHLLQGREEHFQELLLQSSTTHNNYTTRALHRPPTHSKAEQRLPADCNAPTLALCTSCALFSPPSRAPLRRSFCERERQYW